MYMSIDNLDIVKGLIAEKECGRVEFKETTGQDNVIIVTKQGKCITFSENDVRPMGRAAGGVRAIKLEGDDEVVSMSLAHADEELLVVTQNGYGKRTSVHEYKIQARGGKGLLTYDKTKFKKTGELIGAMIVDDDDEVMLINSNGVIIRIKASDVSRLGRATQGVRIMKVDEGTKIISMAKVVKDDNDDSKKNNSPQEDDQISIDTGSEENK